MLVLILLLTSAQLLSPVQSAEDKEEALKSSGVITFNREEALDRTTRNSDNGTCIATQEKLVTLSDSKREILCDCAAQGSSSVDWKDASCSDLVSDKRFKQNDKGHLIVLTDADESEELIFYCSVKGSACVLKITITETHEVSGMAPALQGFIIFLIVTIIALLIFFIVKKYKSIIYLTCRDSCCASSQIDDGKEFDAYVSVGKASTDLKYVERNIVDILQSKYNYTLFIDDENLLPRLDYSEKVQSKMHKCRRLIVVFTPAYMTNEWCMYCLSEGLRKLLELNIQMIFLVSDITIQRELNSLSTLVGQVPKIFISILPMARNETEHLRAIQKIRLLMPPSTGGLKSGRGMRAPMLSDAEDIDQRSLQDRDSYGGTKIYTFNKKAKEDAHVEDVQVADEPEMEYDDDDPNSIKVNQYKAKKDFYSITLVNS